MLPPELTPQIERALAALAPTVIYGFGSFFGGLVRPDSDIDLAYLSDRDSTPLENYEAAQELAAAISRDVHLIPLRHADAVIRARIIGTGIVIRGDDSPARARFEMYALGDYARLNEERAEILRRVDEEGTVLGG